MKRVVFFVVLLLTFVYSLSEYSFLLYGESPDLTYLYITPTSCEQFKNLNITSPQANADFSESFQLAKSARVEAYRARMEAEKQKWSFEEDPLGYTVYGHDCTEPGIASLNYALEAAQKGLLVVGRSAEKLKKMVGENYSGFAAGVLEEVEESESKLKNSESDNDSLGGRIVYAGMKAQKLFEEADEGRALPEFAELIEKCAGSNSILEKEIELNEKIKKAIENLQIENIDAKQNATSKLREARGALESAKAFSTIDKNALVFVSAGGIASGGEAIAPSEMLKKAEKELEEGEKAHFAAQKAEKLTDSTNEYRKAKERFESAINLVKETEKEGKQFEERFEKIEAEEEEKLSALIEKNPNSPFVEKAQLTIEKQAQNLGERIERVKQMKDIEDAIKKYGELSIAKSEAKRALDVLKENIKKAEKDGLEASYEKSKEELLREQLKKAGENIILINEIGDEAEKENNYLWSREISEFSELPQKYEELKKYVNFMSSSQRLKMEEIGEIFNSDNRLNIQYMGKLRSARLSLNELFSSLFSNAPALIKSELEKNLKIRKRIGEVELDKPATIDYEIQTYNSGLSYNGKIIIDKINFPEGSKLIEGNFELSNGKIIISDLDVGREYSGTVRTSKILAHTTADKFQTVYANEKEGRIRENIEFKCEMEGEVIIRRKLNNARVELNGAGIISTYYNATDLAIVVRAVKGKNKISIDYIIEHPISKEISASVTNNFIEYDVKFKDEALALENAVVEFSEKLACTPENIEIIGEMKNKKILVGNALFVNFEGKFENSEQKEEKIIVKCDIFQTDVENLYSELEANLSEMEEMEIRKKIDGGKFGDALRQLLLVKEETRKKELEEKIKAERKEKIKMKVEEMQKTIWPVLRCSNCSSVLIEEINKVNEELKKASGEDAETHLENAEKLMELKGWTKYIKGKVKEMEKCGIDTNEIYGEIETKELLKAEKELRELENKCKEKRKNEESEEENKREIMETYKQIKEKLSKDFQLYENIFYLPGTQRISKKPAEMSRCENAIKECKKIFSKMGKIEERMLNKEQIKYSVNYLQSQINKLEEKRKVIEENIKNFEKKAEKELELATIKGKNIDDAKGEYKKGHALTAYLLAEKAPLEVNKSGQEGDIGNKLWVGILGVIVLIGFLVIFLKGEKNVQFP